MTPPSSPRSLIGALSLLLMSSLTPAAHAQERSEDRVYEQANRHRRRHRDARALELLRVHYESTHEPRALASMGLAEMALQRWAEAERHLVEALAMPPSEWIRANRAPLESSLQQVRARLGVGALIVLSDVAGAEVFVNGTRVGAASESIRVSAGAVGFEIRAPGHDPANRSVTVAPGVTVTERVALRAVVPVEASAPALTPAPAPALTHPPTINVSLAPAPTVVPSSAAPSSSGASTATLRALGWASAAGAAVFLGIGAGTYVAGSNAAERYNSDACLAFDRNRGDVCADELSTARTMGAIAAVGLVTGGALAIASTVLLLVSSTSRTDSRRAWRCGASFAPSISCALEF